MEGLWLLDVLKAYKSSDIYYVVERQDFTYINKILDAFGIPAERRIYCTPDLHIQCPIVYAPPLRNQSHPPADFLGWLRRQGSSQPTTSKFGKRLYITRQGTRARRLRNADKIEPILQSHGFETVHLERLTFGEQAACFQNATHIVAVHGAGLMNLCFSHPGKLKVIELFSPNYVQLQYYYLCARS